MPWRSLYLSQITFQLFALPGNLAQLVLRLGKLSKCSSSLFVGIRNPFLSFLHRCQLPLCVTEFSFHRFTVILTSAIFPSAAVKRLQITSRKAKASRPKGYTSLKAVGTGYFACVSSAVKLPHALTTFGQSHQCLASNLCHTAVITRVYLKPGHHLQKYSSSSISLIYCFHSNSKLSMDEEEVTFNQGTSRPGTSSKFYLPTFKRFGSRMETTSCTTTVSRLYPIKGNSSLTKWPWLIVLLRSCANRLKTGS